MDDLISRQAAVATAISGRVRTLPTTEDGENWIRVNEVMDSLLSLPSAERRGRWEKIELYAPSGDYVMFQCSECASLYYEPSSYCPNCGARMVEE